MYLYLLFCIGTGTGKTLAFSLPVIEKLERIKNGDKYNPQVLILAPTRELANQVNKEISQLGGSNYRTVCIYGGSPYLPQGILLYFFLNNQTLIYINTNRICFT